MLKTADVVVIGGGIIGCSICYYLAKKGADVTQVERSDLASGTTKAGQGGVGSGTDLVKASAKLYGDLTEELSEDIKFTWKGGMQFVVDEEDIPKAVGRVKDLRDSGREISLLTQKEVRAMEPDVADDVIAGVFHRGSGGVDAFKTTYAFARKSELLGAQILQHCAVDEIRVQNGCLTSVVTSEGEIGAKAVVLATGVWAPELAQNLGLTLPVTPRRGHILVTESTPALKSDLSVYEQFGVYAELRRLGKRAADSDNPFVRQGVAWNLIRTGHESYLVGTSRDFAGFDSSIRHDVTRSLAERTVRFLPCLKRVNCIRVYCGFRQYTPDVKPIMGYVDQIKGLVLATGFEGEGIMMAPIVGKLLSELIVDGYPSLSLDEFCYSRFAAEVSNAAN